MSRFTDLIKRYLHDRKNYRFFINNYVEIGSLQRAADAINTLRHSHVLQCEERKAPSAARITIVAPHPDDEVLGPGGTLILCLAAQCDVSVLYLTPGSSRLSDTSTAMELQANALRLGYCQRFLNFPADAIPVDTTAQHRFAHAVTETKPDFLWLPFLTDDEDDNRRANELLMHAVQNGAFKDRPRIWAYQANTSLPANVIIDITAVAAAKEAAINRCTSRRQGRDWAHHVLGLNAANTRFLPGNAPKRYAEAFFDLPFLDYVDLCAQYFRTPTTSCYTKPFYGNGAA